MLIFDDGYMSLVTECIAPLSKYGLDYRRSKNTNIKSALINCEYTAVEKEAENYIFSFDEETLLKALLGDINLLIIRVLLQEDSAKKIYEMFPEFSTNWSLTTDYYSMFFTGSLLLRLTFRGTIFLDGEDRKKLSQSASDVIGERIEFYSNYTYRIVKDEIKGYNLVLNKADKDTHRILWNEVGYLIKDIENHARIDSDEDVLMKAFSNALNANTFSFPSTFRNRVNYQLPYAYKEINKEIYPAKLLAGNTSWLSYIIEAPSGTISDDRDISKLFVSYGNYLHILTHKLICEYYSRYGRESGVISAINKLREHKLGFTDYPYTCEY